MAGLGSVVFIAVAAAILATIRRRRRQRCGPTGGCGANYNKTPLSQSSQASSSLLPPNETKMQLMTSSSQQHQLNASAASVGGGHTKRGPPSVQCPPSLHGAGSFPPNGGQPMGAGGMGQYPRYVRHPGMQGRVGDSTVHLPPQDVMMHSR